MSAAPAPTRSTKPPADQRFPALTVPDGINGISGTPGVVTGRPLTWLRTEGLAVAVAALVLFATTGRPWWLIPALFLVPDLPWLGYLAGPQAGAWLYNLAHTTPLLAAGPDGTSVRSQSPGPSACSTSAWTAF